MMPEGEDHVSWRMEPLGWDKEDRAYYVLDDNRLYRRTDEPPPPPSPKPQVKSKTKKTPKKPKSRGTRASKRRKIEESEDEEMEEEQDAEAGAQEDTSMTNGEATTIHEEEPGYGFTSKTWECIAITLDEYNDFLASIFRTRDANEKQLRKRIEEDVLPVIEKRAEALRNKQMKKLRELENLQKMATAKRSGRLADKAEKEKADREVQEAEERKQAELRMAHEEQDRQRRIEEGHESRRLTREQRLKEREVKRILHEEELAKIEEQANRPESGGPSSEAANDSEKRVSKRQLKTQKEQHQKELEKLGHDDDKWYFDCSVCGQHGENWDDGTHSIACDRCEVWQHSKCHGYSPKQAESDDFKFVCATCKRKEEDANKPKIPPLKLGKSRSSASPESQKKSSRPSTANRQPAPPLPDHVQRQLDGIPDSSMPRASPGPFGKITNTPSFPPQDQYQRPPSGYGYPAVSNFAHQAQTPKQHWQGSAYSPSGRRPSGQAGSPQPYPTNGYAPHYQQHQQAHQNAVSAAGGHPSYQPPHQTQQGYARSPGAPAGGQYPNQPQQPQQQQPYQPPQQQYYQQQAPYAPQHAPYQYQHQQQPPAQPAQKYHQQQRPGSAQLMNGFQSPVKNAAHPAPPPQHIQRSPQGQPPAPQQHGQHPMHSPNANFPPPLNGYAQHIAPSPVKSSPAQPPPQTWQPPQYQQHQAPSHLAHTPQQSFRPPSANGVNPTLQTPHQHLNPSPAGANANAIAADGMSGPWPETSKSIPQKHDQSPAPPSYPHQSSDTKFTPPVALAPSPGQAAQSQASGPQSVPVKRMPETNGAPFVPSAQAMKGKGVAPSPGLQMAPSPGPGYPAGVPNGTPTHAPGLSMVQLADQQQQRQAQTSPSTQPPPQ